MMTINHWFDTSETTVFGLYCEGITVYMCEMALKPGRTSQDRQTPDPAQTTVFRVFPDMSAIGAYVNY